MRRAPLWVAAALAALPGAAPGGQIAVTPLHDGIAGSYGDPHWNEDRHILAYCRSRTGQEVEVYSETDFEKPMGEIDTGAGRVELDADRIAVRGNRIYFGVAISRDDPSGRVERLFFRPQAVSCEYRDAVLGLK